MPVAGSALAAAFPPAPAPDATPDASRPGYHLVFKGFKLAGSVYWVPADSPQSRPWLRDTGNDEDRRHRSTLVRPAPDAAAADPLRGHRDDVAPDAAPDAA